MAATPPTGETGVDEIAAAHALLREHYGDEVRPIKEVCAGIQAWLGAIRDEHLPEITEDERWRDPALHKLATAWHDVGLGIGVTASKSNLLYRLLYRRQSLRTEKCPIHKGRWSGCEFGIARCGCQDAQDITGWLP